MTRSFDNCLKKYSLKELKQKVDELKLDKAMKSLPKKELCSYIWKELDYRNESTMSKRGRKVKSKVSVEPPKNIPTVQNISTVQKNCLDNYKMSELYKFVDENKLKKKLKTFSKKKICEEISNILPIKRSSLQKRGPKIKASDIIFEEIIPNTGNSKQLVNCMQHFSKSELVRIVDELNKPKKLKLLKKQELCTHLMFDLEKRLEDVDTTEMNIPNNDKTEVIKMDSKYGRNICTHPNLYDELQICK